MTWQLMTLGTQPNLGDVVEVVRYNVRDDQHWGMIHVPRGRVTVTGVDLIVVPETDPGDPLDPFAPPAPQPVVELPERPTAPGIHVFWRPL
jgi:hypothetical protein